MRRFLLGWLLAALTLFIGTALADPIKIPLKTGLVLNYSGFDPGVTGAAPQELSRLVLITGITADDLTYETQFTDNSADPAKRKQISLTRTQRRIDLETAHKLIFKFFPDDPPNMPGLNLWHASREMLNDLLQTGKTKFVFGDAPQAGHGAFDATTRQYYRGDLTVVDADVPVEVLIAGTPASLSSIHVHGSLKVGTSNEEDDFWFSKDMANPLLLRAEGSGGNWISLVNVDLLPDLTSVTAHEGATSHSLAQFVNSFSAGVIIADAKPEESKPIDKFVLAKLALDIGELSKLPSTVPVDEDMFDLDGNGKGKDLVLQQGKGKPDKPAALKGLPGKDQAANNQPSAIGLSALSDGTGKAAFQQLAANLSSGKCRARLPGIYFDTGSAVLLTASYAALDQISSLLKQHPEWVLNIEGHTDNVGTDEYNLDLSKRRAASVRNSLVNDYGLDGSHFTTEGFGESRPIDTNASPVGRAHNRRVEMARKCE